MLFGGDFYDKKKIIKLNFDTKDNFEIKCII